MTCVPSVVSDGEQDKREMAANAAQLYLLSDHLKLSLLEKERAAALDLEANAQDAEISRSLDAFGQGLRLLESRESQGDQEQATETQLSELRKQYAGLQQQFDGGKRTSRAGLSQPNNESLSSDFSRAQSGRTTKSVRFHDNPKAEDAAHEGLFPYRDEPEQDQVPDHEHLDNQQVHQYHSQVIQDQDEQLDQLGLSIGRQRELSIQIGDELDEQAQILDDVDQGVDRHQTQITRARNRLGKIARKAKDNLSMTIILSLIIILILLIVLTR